MLTTDFSGTYDYEAGEASAEFECLMEYSEEYSTKELHAKVEKLQKHRSKVLTPEGFLEFAKQWNSLCKHEGLSLGYYMIP